jgi:hypothetical protein
VGAESGEEGHGRESARVNLRQRHLATNEHELTRIKNALLPIHRQGSRCIGSGKREDWKESMKKPKDETPRQRSTWRLSNHNYDFVHLESTRLGVSMNGALNVLLAELRSGRRQNDTRVTAKLESRKVVQ